MVEFVLKLYTITLVSGWVALTQPFSMAKGATPAIILPQVGVVSTIG